MGTCTPCPRQAHLWWNTCPAPPPQDTWPRCSSPTCWWRHYHQDLSLWRTTDSHLWSLPECSCSRFCPKHHFGSPILFVNTTSPFSLPDIWMERYIYFPPNWHSFVEFLRQFAHEPGWPGSAVGPGINLSEDTFCQRTFVGASSLLHRSIDNWHSLISIKKINFNWIDLFQTYWTGFNIGTVLHPLCVK